MTLVSLIAIIMAVIVVVVVVPFQYGLQQLIKESKRILNFMFSLPDILVYIHYTTIKRHMFCLKENLVKAAVFSQGKLHCKENKNKNSNRKIITPTTYTHTQQLQHK